MGERDIVYRADDSDETITWSHTIAFPRAYSLALALLVSPLPLEPVLRLRANGRNYCV